MYSGEPSIHKDNKMSEIMETFFLYYRLVMYPLLAYTLILEGMTIIDCDAKMRKPDRTYILTALFFMMLWATSVLALIVRNNDVITTFNRYTLLPVGTILLMYLWIKIIQRCRQNKKEIKRMTEDSVYESE